MGGLAIGLGAKPRGPKLVRGRQVPRSIYEGSGLSSSGAKLGCEGGASVVPLEAKMVISSQPGVRWGSSWARWKAYDEGYTFMNSDLVLLLVVATSGCLAISV